MSDLGNGIDDDEEYKEGEYLASLKQGFLGIDTSLKSGGLKEVAQIRKDNPPNKSPIMNILSDMTKAKKSLAEGSADDGETTATDDGDDDNSLESMETIGCTANVALINF